MQRITLTNDLTRYEKSQSLLNLMVSFWFTKTKAKIDKSKNTARKKKWAKLDPFVMDVLIPTRTTGKYYLVDRPAGLLLAHSPVPALTWPRFFAWLKKSHPPGDYPNEAIQTLVEQGATLGNVEAALADDTTWAGSPAIWKTVDEDQDDVILVTGTPLSDKEIVTLIQTQFFQNYRFQSAIYTYNTPPEDNKPLYYTAALALKDDAFQENERQKTLYVINLGQFKPDEDDSAGEDGDGESGEDSNTDTGEDTDTGNSTGTGDSTGTDKGTGTGDQPQDEQDTTDTPT